MAQSKSVRLVTEAALDTSQTKVLAPIKGDIADLKVLGGLNPGSPNDASTSNFIETPGTLTHTALSAAIDGSIEGVIPSRVSVGATNHTSMLKEYILDLAAGRMRGGLLPGLYRAEDLVLPPLVTLDGLGGQTARFGTPTPYEYGAVRIQRPAGSTSAKPIISLEGSGAAIRNLTILGNTTDVGPGVVNTGFETGIDTVRIIAIPNIALDVQRANNTRWSNIFIDNSGTSTLPGMKVWSKNGVGSANETNTLDIYGLTIERCVNVHLDLAYNPNNLADTEYWCEFLRIHNLHIESTIQNAGAGSGAGNTSAMIRIGNVRSVDLVSPFLYGGPGAIIEHNQQFNRSWGNGGIRLLGGILSGSDTGTGLAPSVELVNLIKGSGFVASGTEFRRYSGNAVKAQTTYGENVIVEPSCLGGKFGDARAARTTLTMAGDMVLQGQIRSSPGSNPSVTSVVPGRYTAIVNGSDVAGKVFFATTAEVNTGEIVKVTFNKPYDKEVTVVLTPGTPEAAAMNAHVSSTATGFTIRATNAPVAGQPQGTYQFGFIVIG